MRKKGCPNERSRGPEPQGQSTILENNQQSHWANQTREETNKTHQSINKQQDQVGDGNRQHLCCPTGQGPQNPLRHIYLYFNHEHKAEVDMWAESMKEHLTPRSAPAAPSDEYSRTITSEDTYKALKSLKNKTSPGEDTIPYIALKNLPEPAIDELTKTFDTCLQIGYFPKKWKHAIGKMIQKTNKPKDNPASYRPISLLNCMGKLFEKIVSNRIQEFIEDNNIINPWQRAYQPHKEANEHIMIINEYMKKVKENKKLAALLLMDVEKAFDAVWHNGLLKKLHDMELPGDILRIISSFLTDRTIQVRIGNTLSEVVKLLAGTPQGSILSPRLFILFVNDIPVTQACQVTQYVDDIAIYTSHRNPRYLEAHLQKQVDELEDWCEDWFIKPRCQENSANDHHPPKLKENDSHHCQKQPSGNPRLGNTSRNHPR